MARSLLPAAGLLVLVCGAGAQTPPPPTPPILPTLPPELPPALPGKVATAAARAGATPAPAPAAEQPVEELLRELETLHAQKAQIEKREADLRTTLKKRLEELQRRVDRLDGRPGAPTAGRPDRVGRVMVVGFGEKQDGKVLAAVRVVPGQVILYPELEAGRARLEKAGYRGAEVLVLPNESDSEFKDVLIRAAPAADR